MNNRTKLSLTAIFRRLPPRIPALFVLPACLALFPASAFATDPAAGNGTARPKVEYADVAPALARMVKERAAFFAEVEPLLLAAGYRDDRDDRNGRPWKRQRRRLAGYLWQLRSLPDLLDARKAILLAPVEIRKDDERSGRRRDAEYAREEVLRGRALALEEMVEQARYLARAIRESETGDGARNECRRQTRRDSTPAEGIRAGLDREGASDRYFVFALEMRSRLGTSEENRSIDRRALAMLWRLRDRQEDASTALAILKETRLRRDERDAMVERLVANPAQVRDEFSHLPETLAAKKIYAFLVEQEAPYETISLPLAAVMPRAVGAVEKAGIVPLAAKPVAAPAPGLSMRRLTELLPRDMRDALEKENRPAGAAPAVPPFTRPGERLYMMLDQLDRPDAGGAIADGTPLAGLGAAGPRLLEYGSGYARVFRQVLSAAADNIAISWYSRPLLIAAACPPEELAAHLSSLMVMQTERERSLFGPFDAYVWKSENAPRDLRRDSPDRADHPKDMPGSAFRLVKITEQPVFTALAPRADAAGLARLMGPIRGIWAYEGPSRDTPWQELRYEPASVSLPKTEPLGKAPILSLDKAALESIAAKEREFVTLAMAWNALERGCAARQPAPEDNATCAGQWAEALARMQTRMAELFGKGFVSPLDAAMAIHILERHADDAVMTATMTAIINNTAKPSVERVNAMQAATETARKQSRPRP